MFQKCMVGSLNHVGHLGTRLENDNDPSAASGYACILHTHDCLESGRFLHQQKYTSGICPNAKSWGYPPALYFF